MQNNTQLLTYGIFLAKGDAALLNEYFNSTVYFIDWSKENINSKQFLHSTPLLLFVSPEGENYIRNLDVSSRTKLQNIPKVFLLPSGYSEEDIELALTSGAADIIKSPITKKDAWSLVLKAHEVQNMHKDIRCMTRELLLERELLEQKNELLSFLVSFFSTTTKELECNAILAKAYRTLANLLRLRSMHALIWHDVPHGESEASIFINATPGSSEYKAWEKTLFAEANEHLGEKCTFSKINKKTLVLGEGEGFTPDTIDFFPIQFTDNKNLKGIMLFASNENKGFGRAHNETLMLALNYLGLMLSNSFLYQKAQNEANIDPLTALYNRRYLTNRLEEETRRVKRYAQPLGLLMLDIDHFKKVNDKYGHQIGDEVLKELANVIKPTLRDTDYCCRYGGEEFSILLPATNYKQANLVAERLRAKIASTFFTKFDLQISVSIGLAHMTQEDDYTTEQLVSEADIQLYKAKANGRNCVCHNAKLEIYTDQVI